MAKKGKIVVKCGNCGKKPSEIQEYIDMAKSEGYSSPESFVRAGDGTYNKITGLFYCTKCYVELGMPNGKA